uniref:Uncharacterized protein n=1 Tax=Cacopsylla melanoneura TaxID=428564 RepID=A0A8D9BS98_9HEMI
MGVVFFGKCLSRRLDKFRFSATRIFASFSQLIFWMVLLFMTSTRTWRRALQRRAAASGACNPCTASAIMPSGSCAAFELNRFLTGFVESPSSSVLLASLSEVSSSSSLLLSSSSLSSSSKFIWQSGTSGIYSGSLAFSGSFAFVFSLLVSLSGTDLSVLSIGFCVSFLEFSIVSLT